MIVILGESASGKTTLLQNFLEKNHDYHKIITYTTRPMRDGETDGTDYHFVSQEGFDKLVKNDFFVEYTKYNDYFYGTAKVDCESDKAVAIITPSGLRALKRLGYNVTSVYLGVDRRSRLTKLLSRGDDIDESYRRNLSDVGQFEGIEHEVEYVISNPQFYMPEEEVLKCFQKIINAEVYRSSRFISSAVL